MKKKLVSVIIPVFNNEKELDKCLKSVLEQDYPEIEIILLDDASDDSSIDVCKRIASTDARIVYYSLEKSGVSRARNIGLDNSHGEYVIFIDADDFLTKKSISKRVALLEEKSADLVACRYIREYKSSVKLPVERLEKEGSYTNTEYYINTLTDPGHHYYGVVWNKIYKRSIIEDNNIRFREDVDLGEDFIFNLTYLKYCNNIYASSDLVYIYNKKRTSTLSKNIEKALSHCKIELENRKKIFEVYTDIFKQFNLYDDNKGRVYFYWCVFWVRQIQGLKSEYTDWSEDDRREWARIIADEEIIIYSLSITDEKKIKEFENKYVNSSKLKQKVKNLVGVHTF